MLGSGMHGAVYAGEFGVSGAGQHPHVDAPGIAADAPVQFAGADSGWLTAGAAQP